jgi:hypothetical protein
MAQAQKMVILEEAVLMNMATNPNFVKEFPFLSGLKLAAKSNTGCGRCGQRSSNRVSVVNGIKSSIVSMDVAQKQKLKKLLNAEKIRVRVASGGKITEYTF